VLPELPGAKKTDAQGEQPGLADPYHVLHLIHTERGEEKKAKPSHRHAVVAMEYHGPIPVEFG